MKHIKKVFLVLTFLITINVRAQLPPEGNGYDGTGPSPVTSTISLDGTRAAVNSITQSGSTVILSLDAGHEYGSFTAGSTPDRVLIILMSKSGTPLPTRNWQMADVITVGTHSLTVTNFAFTNWCTSASSTCKIQVIKVPQYTSLTINSGGKLTCSAWDGYTGGVLAFVANNSVTIASGGWLDVAGKGFQNPNSGGAGGAGAASAGPPLGQGSTPGENGNSGPVFSLLLQKEGQAECHRGSGSITPGGWGGMGGFSTPGDPGTAGSTPQTRLSLPKSVAPKLLMLGNAGAQGNGGRGGGAGGSGGNGGNGYTVGSPTGIAGGAGLSGGAGGKGGFGGGNIICFAGVFTTPTSPSPSTSTLCIDISGTNGDPGSDGTTSTATSGKGGDGGNGGDGYCNNGLGLYYGYGAGGIRGQRGQGASGGSGGGGGSIGSFSIRTVALSDNHLDKYANVKYNPGTGGAKGNGQAAGTAGTDGADGSGCGDLETCANPNQVCLKRKYTVFDCAGFEAFQVLADMDQATDYGGYIKFTKTSSSPTTFSKKNTGNNITNDPDYYFCLYFKCSKLLMAFEDYTAVSNATAVYDPVCTTVLNYKELPANMYWVKLKNNICAFCDDLMDQYYDDIVNGSPPFSWTASVAGSIGTKDFGTVSFGPGGNKYIYYDSDRNIDEGYWYLNGAETERCEKQCYKSGFNAGWMDINHYNPCPCKDNPTGNPGDPAGPGGVNEAFPNIPYIPELWDTDPKQGDDGQPGDLGDSDDDAFDGGEFDPGEEDGTGETPVYLGVPGISAIGKHFAVSPNPAGNELVLVSKQAAQGNQVSLKIFDVSGKLVWEKQDIKMLNTNINSDISKLPAGTYFVRIITDNTSETLKFVKQ